MIKGLFFDLDGTLVDTHTANYEAYKLAIAEYGVEITFEQYAQTIGHQARHFLPILAPGLSDDEYVKITERKAELYRDVMRLTNLNIRLVRFMQLASEHHVVALVTTAKAKNTRTVLKHHGLIDAFDFMITADDVTHSKPDPECYLLALERAGLSPSEVLVFEDSEPGITAASAAHITSIIQIKDYA